MTLRLWVKVTLPEWLTGSPAIYSCQRLGFARECSNRSGDAFLLGPFEQEILSFCTPTSICLSLCCILQCVPFEQDTHSYADRPPGCPWNRSWILVNGLHSLSSHNLSCCGQTHCIRCASRHTRAMAMHHHAPELTVVYQSYREYNPPILGVSWPHGS